MRLKILIYEDNSALATSLQTWFQINDEFDLVGIMNNPSNILSEIRALSPDIILMDIDMPIMNGVEALKVLRANRINLPVIMLTVFDDDHNILEAIQAGANGYILKKNFDQIIPAIKDVLSGGAPMSGYIARRVLELFSKKLKPSFAREEYTLSSRENEILELLTQGYSYKMIADKLSIALDTVRNHIKNIYRKLDVNSATEAIYKFMH